MGGRATLRATCIKEAQMRASLINTVIMLYKLYEQQTPESRLMHAWEMHACEMRCTPVPCTLNTSSSLGRICLLGQPYLKFRGQPPRWEGTFPGSRPPKV